MYENRDIYTENRGTFAKQKVKKSKPELTRTEDETYIAKRKRTWIETSQRIETRTPKLTPKSKSK